MQELLQAKRKAKEMEAATRKEKVENFEFIKTEKADEVKGGKGAKAKPVKKGKK